MDEYKAAIAAKQSPASLDKKQSTLIFNRKRPNNDNSLHDTDSQHRLLYQAWHLRQQELTNAIVNLVAEAGLPFQLEETRGFECFMTVVDKKFQGVSRRMITRKLVCSLDDMMCIQCKQLHDAKSAGSSIHATTDLWSSRANNSIIRIRFHFVDKYFNCNIKTAIY